MDRRKTIKTLLVGTVAGAGLTTVGGCKPNVEEKIKEVVADAQGLYGRTPTELARDKKIKAEIYLDKEELETIAILCDIILPATETAGAASDADVAGFIEFIVKDIPSHQLAIRGGLMWLNIESNNRFAKAFKDCSNKEQIEIVEDIAYPDPDNNKPTMAHGIKFFDLMRNLTLTGYYTSKIGIKDLGYKGNTPNVWDGIPAEVLKKHDVDYDPEWLAKCVDQEKRDVTAEWDEEMNLLT